MRLESGVARAARWGRRVDLPPPGVGSAAFDVLASAYYLTGGLLALGVVWLQPQTEHPAVVAALGAAALVVGAAVPWLGPRLMAASRHALNLGGTGTVLAMVVLAGADPAGQALFWLFCLPPVGAFVFFRMSWAVPMLVWVAAATAIATFGFHVMPPAEWFAVVLIGAVVAITVRWLVRYASDAEWDAATGVLSRAGLVRALTLRTAQADQGGDPFSVAVVKVDDAAGPDGAGPASDGRARELAEAWRPGTPDNVTWARIGDLDFAVLWDGATGFDEYLDRIYRRAGGGAAVTIGFCDFHPGMDPVQLLHEAYRGRAYSARTGGGITRTGLVSAQVRALRAALEQGRIVPHYQPVVELRTGRIVGAEALARWHDPERGWIPPDEFIPLAEHAGLIGALGERILRQACHAAAAWPHGPDDAVRLAVNISASQLRDDRLLTVIDDALAASGLPPHRLTIEVTESTLAQEAAAAHAILAALRDRGVTVALDDFGTGYSSLARLAGLPIDVLKIDRTFVQQLGHGDRPLIQWMLDLAVRTGLHSVVEGVETEQQASAVRSFGAGYAQGWLFGRPQPDEQFRTTVAGWRSADPAIV